MNSKTLAMADDATCLVRRDLETLKRIKQILREFGTLSGLCCNIQKTALIPVGLVDEIPQEILELGFEVKESATILGMDISNDWHDLDETATKITNKIQKESNWWSRFNLNLLGRISVAKSMLYSQVNYLGSFLPFSQVHHLSFSKPIEKFVNGNLKATEVKNGGLGLVRMADFLNCQKCGWLPLTKTSTKNGNLTFLRVMGGKWDQHTNLNSPPTKY